MDNTHVCSEDFNKIRSQEEFYQRYINYFKNKNIPKDIDGFTVEILLLEAYHDIYRIIDLDDENIAIPLLRFTNADTLGELGPIAERVATFKTNNLNEIFGLSIKEYFDLPIPIAEAVICIAKAEKQFEQKIKNSLPKTD